MKKANAAAFETVLNTIVQRGITTRSALMADSRLYAEYFLAARDFAAFALRSRSGKPAPGGVPRSGNWGKVELLEALGVTTREDITMDCVVRMTVYLENILQKPTVAYMKNYAYAIVNSVVNTAYRRLPPENIRLLSLNSAIADTKGGTECTYEDLIADNTYNPACICTRRETLRELEQLLREKQTRLLAEKKAPILREISLLAQHPAELMVRLACTHLNMKTRVLANLILSKGCEHAYAEILLNVAGKYRIPPEELRGCISGHTVTAASVKADTGDGKAVAGQISRLVYRAGKRLGK